MLADRLLAFGQSATSGQQFDAAIGLLTANAVGAGSITLDMPPLAVLRAIAGVANASAGAGWDEAARHMVDISLAGLTTRQKGFRIDGRFHI